MEKRLKLSVHQLVDFVLRTGDIDNRIFNRSSMNEGTRIHAFYQSKQASNYLSEYLLGGTFYVDGYTIFLEGRADGIIVDGDFAVIDEIKSTVVELKDYHTAQEAWHVGQAQCYALMYAKEKNLDSVGVRLTYIHQTKDDRMVKNYVFSREELEQKVTSYIQSYLDFYSIIVRRLEKRNETSGTLNFPFLNFRKGQRELAKYAYGIAKNGGTLFAEAPTGIGKTISTLYPFVRSFSDGVNEKIFYLTAKNSGKEAARQAVELMKSKGVKLTEVVVTAKDKICFCPGKACNPDECPFAKDYYTKIRDVMTKSLTRYDAFDPSRISRIAAAHHICPFEMQLDLSLYVDIIICDYNYLFDPLVYFRRYFDNDASNMLVLVDEAHNLVDRGRDMYSASIDSFAFEKARKAIRKLDHKKMKNAIKRIAKLFKEIKETSPIGETVLEYFDSKTIRALEAFLLAAQDINRNHHSYVDEAFRQFFLDINRFLKIFEFVDDSFTLFVTRTDDKIVEISIFCLDPSRHLARSLTQVKGRILFSATLSPHEYYVDIIGGRKEDPVLLLPSPFDANNLLLMIAPTVSVKYKNRGETYQVVAHYIENFVSHKVGNYLIYAPSHAYLAELVNLLEFPPDCDVFVQNREMDDIEKEKFLERFQLNPTKTTIGVVVVGGVFGEGIDLVDDRLIGVVIIGVGLPQIGFERDLIRDYFDQRGQQGYEYAYVNPGMNRVMQAVGRVIRSEKDRGMALLIDDRFLNARYRVLFKHEWSHYDVVISPEDMAISIESFWKKA
ncbi:MAG: helicase C-terminal domain-containing protein [Bacilli bacterium]